MYRSAFIVLIVLVGLYTNYASCQVYACSQMQQLTSSVFTANRTAAICISYYESGWNTQDVNGASVGLFQLSEAECGNANLLDPVTNAQCASNLMKVYGLKFFPAWKQGKCNSWTACMATASTKVATPSKVSARTGKGPAATTNTPSAASTGSTSGISSASSSPTTTTGPTTGGTTGGSSGMKQGRKVKPIKKKLQKPKLKIAED